MATPALAATNQNGVYYTADVGIKGDPQPEWYTINTGLTELALDLFVVDPYFPTQYQFAIGANKIFRNTNIVTGNWSEILPAESGNLYGIGPDDGEPGRYYALAGENFNTVNDGRVRLYKSSDFGETWDGGATIWTNETVGAFDNVPLRSLGTLVARDRTIWYTSNITGGGQCYIWYSANDGATWTQSATRTVYACSTCRFSLQTSS